MKLINIKKYEKGLVFKDNELVDILEKGRHIFANPFDRSKVEIVSTRHPWIVHEDFEIMEKSGLLEKHAKIIDLKDNQRGLVWIDKRFDSVVGPGLYGFWNEFHDIDVEIIKTENLEFIHKDINTISRSKYIENELYKVDIDEGYKALFFRDGKFEKIYEPGQYMFWKNEAKIKFFHVDMRERLIDISGQDIMTKDKVTLRINALLSYRVKDLLKAVTLVDDYNQSLYREAQLALRGVIGTYELDEILGDKEKIVYDLEKSVKTRGENLGLETSSFGIRDIILPGEMKDILNRVIEAKKAADANLITRREETAAMRSQANTAKLLENNPVLMRLKELDILEKIASDSKMNIVLGEKGLSDRVMNLL